MPKQSPPVEAVSKEEKEEIYTALLKARVALASALPYLSDLLYAIQILEESPLAGVALRGYVAINPDWQVCINHANMRRVKDILEDEERFGTFCMFLLYHEALHILLDHFQRGNGKEPYLWNIAADMEVNPMAAELFPSIKTFLEVNVYLPHHGGFPLHMTAEWYYENLLDRTVEESQRDVDTLYGGEERENGKAPSDLTKHAIRLKVAHEIARYAQSGIGNVPRHLLRIAEEILEPKVDWRKSLRRYIQRCLQQINAQEGDFTYQRPHKKTPWYRSPTPVLPSKIAPQPHVAVIVDTSASMDKETLGQAVAELREIVRSLGCPVHLISCDADVQTVLRVWGQPLSREKIQKLLVGGGGTVLTKAILYAQRKLKAELIVALTDGMSYWDGAEDVRVPVVLGVINEAIPAGIPEKFSVIHIEPPRKREGG